MVEEIEQLSHRAKGEKHMWGRDWEAQHAASPLQGSSGLKDVSGNYFLQVPACRSKVMEATLLLDTDLDLSAANRH